jgi:hypothetical protein
MMRQRGAMYVDAAEMCRESGLSVLRTSGAIHCDLTQPQAPDKFRFGDMLACIII